MRIVPAIALCCLVTAHAVAAHAGGLAPGLERRLADAGPDEPVRVLVVLGEQVDLPALARELRAGKARAPERHRRVVEALRAAADRSQGPLRAALGADKTAGRVLGWTPHWLLNAVVVTATPDAVRALAARPDVARVEADLVAELIEPVPTGKAGAVKTPGPDKAGLGMTPGVRAVNAARVWRELGIDGTGQVVGIIDTGVDGTHPALAERWRGNFAPAAESWFDAAGLGDDEFPVDRHYHGTHVMGTLTGLAPGDTIGVAPGAMWIAANAINNPADGADYDNGIIAALEFMADPDGDPATVDDVPAVVQNSWGVSEAYAGYVDCDSRWWDVLDAVEAAGVVLTWSAGNEGPNPGTVRSPADRATSPLNAFSVGSVSPYAPFPVSIFSSRGPSGCGGEYAVKPEVVAPGEDVLSCRPGGGYQYLSGTSMAGPHVAGVVALMRAAAPDADVAAIKQALLDTALDLLPAGEDNASGRGMVDAYAAVTAVMGGVGEVAGAITDADGGLPVAGAEVRLVGGWHRAVTGADGTFRMVVRDGPAALTVTAFGYRDGLLEIDVPDGGVVSGDLALQAWPLATVDGTITGPDGELVGGAVVSVENAPVVPDTTGADGRYALLLPAGPGVTHTLRARGPGYGSAVRTVAFAGPLTVDFALPPRTAEDFESGGFRAYSWEHDGDADWTIDETSAYEGAFSARAGALGNYGLSRLALDYDVLDEGDLVFRYRVSCEAGYDNLRFYVDGVLQESWSGQTGWFEHAHTLGPGPHRLMWSYEKDESVAEGDDTAWIDLVEFPPRATPLVPEVVVAPAEVGAATNPGGTVEVPLEVANLGDAPLEFSVLAGAVPAVFGVENPVRHVRLDKTVADPRSGVDRTAGAGGPDAFGYAWRDSDDPYGPAWAWTDIAGDGVPVALADDQVSPPFDLGFAFPFYAGEFTQVRICSNGFLSFTSSSTAWTNQGIPDAAEPNNLIAPFWDDLAPDAGGTVHVRSGPDRFVVQFTDVPHYGMPQVTETFQAVLHADGAIEFRYAEVGDDGSATVGIENGGGSDGLLVQFNSPGSLRDGLAIRIAAEPPPPWLTVGAPGGTVDPAGATTVTVRCAAGGLAPGTHRAVLSVISNDPLRPVVAVPVTLTIGDTAHGPDLPGAVVFAGAVPNPFNPAAELRFVLPREAAVSLRIYDVAGRLVRTLPGGLLPAGPHARTWDGRDDRGRGAASGAYVARLVVDGVPSVRAMTLLR